MVPTSATLFNYNKTAPEIKLPWAITKFHQNLKRATPKQTQAKPRTTQSQTTKQNVDLDVTHIL